MQEQPDPEQLASTQYGIVKMMADRGEWDEAEAALRRIPAAKREWRADAYHVLIRKLIEGNQRQRAARLLADALPVARAIGSDVGKAWSIAALAEHYLALRNTDTAVRLWRESYPLAVAGQASEDAEDSLDCSKLLGIIATRLIEMGQTDLAAEVVAAISNEVVRRRVQTSIANG